MSARPLALCGVLTALAAALLALGGVIPGMVFCAPILAMGALLPVLEELGPKAAGTSYAAAAILALLLAPDRETAFVYLFFGWYPILRPRIAALPSRLLRLAARLAVCNVTALLLYGLVPAGPGPDCGVQRRRPPALRVGPAAHGPDGGAAGVRLVL